MNVFTPSTATEHQLTQAYEELSECDKNIVIIRRQWESDLHGLQEKRNALEGDSKRLALGVLREYQKNAKATNAALEEKSNKLTSVAEELEIQTKQLAQAEKDLRINNLQLEHAKKEATEARRSENKRWLEAAEAIRKAQDATTKALSERGEARKLMTDVVNELNEYKRSHPTPLSQLKTYYTSDIPNFSSANTEPIAPGREHLFTGNAQNLRTSSHDSEEKNMHAVINGRSDDDVGSISSTPKNRRVDDTDLANTPNATTSLVELHPRSPRTTLPYLPIDHASEDQINDGVHTTDEASIPIHNPPAHERAAFERERAADERKRQAAVAKEAKRHADGYYRRGHPIDPFNTIPGVQINPQDFGA